MNDNKRTDETREELRMHIDAIEMCLYMWDDGAYEYSYHEFKKQISYHIKKAKELASKGD